MTQGFWEGWSRHLFTWYGFLFTVVGTVIGLVLAKEHWWLCILLTMGAFAASGTFAYVRHKAFQEELLTYAERLRVADSSTNAMTRRADEAEGKIAQISNHILASLVQVHTQYSYAKVTESFAQHADFLARMRSFLDHLKRPLNVKIFSHQSGQLYALAKIEPAVARHVRVGDPFVLVRVSSGGLEVPAAQLIVHQPPDESSGFVAFRIASYLADEMGHIEKLAQATEVDGMKGYTIKCACDLDSYENVDFGNLAKGVRLIVREFMHINWE